MPTFPSRFAVDAPTAWLDDALRLLIALGLTLVVLLPAARGFDAQLGWLPLWLVAMPAVARWALHRFRLPRWPRDDDAQVVARALPRRRPQAHRRSRKAIARAARSRAA